MASDPDDLRVRPARRDQLEDAAGLARVLNGVIAEGRFTALAGHWTPEAGPRSKVFVAEVEGQIVGFQVVEPFVSYTTTMDHVAHFGTYVEARYRGRGIGRRLAEVTLAFARNCGYEKSVIYVLSDNQRGIDFYRSLGFVEKGVLTRQTKIDGVYHDEVLMELHFEEA